MDMQSHKHTDKYSCKSYKHNWLIVEKHTILLEKHKEKLLDHFYFRNDAEQQKHINESSYGIKHQWLTLPVFKFNIAKMAH